jgi:hypothetical protein
LFEETGSHSKGRAEFVPLPKLAIEFFKRHTAITSSSVVEARWIDAISSVKTCVSGCIRRHSSYLANFFFVCLSLESMLLRRTQMLF